MKSHGKKVIASLLQLDKGNRWSVHHQAQLGSSIRIFHVPKQANTLDSSGIRVYLRHYPSSVLSLERSGGCDVVIIGCKLDGLLRLPWWIVLSPMWLATAVLISVHCWKHFSCKTLWRRKREQQNDGTVLTLLGSIVLFEGMWILWLDGIRNIQLLIVVSPLCIWSASYLGQLAISFSKRIHSPVDGFTTESRIIDPLFVIILLTTTAITYDYVNIIPNSTPPIILLLYVAFKLCVKVITSPFYHSRLLLFVTIGRHSIVEWYETPFEYKWLGTYRAHHSANTRRDFPTIPNPLWSSIYALPSL